MSIMEYNGSALVAMVGKDCVAMASDRRLGVQQTTVGNNMKKMFKVHDSLSWVCPGLQRTCKSFQRGRVQDGVVRVKGGKEDQTAVFRQHTLFVSI